MCKLVRIFFNVENFTKTNWKLLKFSSKKNVWVEIDGVLRLSSKISYKKNCFWSFLENYDIVEDEIKSRKKCFESEDLKEKSRGNLIEVIHDF